MSTNKAVFLDKDGVLNIDIGISKEISETKLFEHSGGVISYLREKGYKIIVVTNQPIVARGIVSENELKIFLSEFEKLLKSQNENALIDKIYYCPHHPNANILEYRINCDCRKPKAGMLLKAADEFKINLNESFMVGDRVSDIIAGKNAGCKTVFCKTGKHLEKMIETDIKYNLDIKADFEITEIGDLKKLL